MVLLFTFYVCDPFWVKFCSKCEVWGLSWCCGFVLVWFCGFFVFVFVFAYGYPVDPASFIEKALFLPLNHLCKFVKNQLELSWVLCSVPLICVSISVLTAHSLDYCSYITSRENQVDWSYLPYSFPKSF